MTNRVLALILFLEHNHDPAPAEQTGTDYPSR